MKMHYKKIIELVKKEGVVTSSEVSKMLNIGWNTAEKYLLELAVEKKIVKIKKLGVNLWMLG